jgi:hypothetical protein
MYFCWSESRGIILKKEKEHTVMNENRTAKNGGVRKKLFLLCSILIITTSAVFALIDIFELRVLMKVVTETNKSQNETIKKRSEEALTRLTYENMQNTISLAARNVDGEFWTMRHDFTILAEQVKDVFDPPDKYGEREVHGPDPAKKGNILCSYCSPIRRRPRIRRQRRWLESWPTWSR